MSFVASVNKSSTKSMFTPRTRANKLLIFCKYCVNAAVMRWENKAKTPLIHTSVLSILLSVWLSLKNAQMLLLRSAFMRKFLLLLKHVFDVNLFQHLIRLKQLNF